MPARISIFTFSHIPHHPFHIASPAFIISSLLYLSPPVPSIPIFPSVSVFFLTLSYHSTVLIPTLSDPTPPRPPHFVSSPSANPAFTLSLFLIPRPTLSKVLRNLASTSPPPHHRRPTFTLLKPLCLPHCLECPTPLPRGFWGALSLPKKQKT